jgi:chromosome segregation ATPase
LAERAEELDTAIKELEDQLAQQEKEANTAIHVWESKTNELEKDLDVALMQLKEVRATLNLNEQEPLASTLEILMNEREKAMEDRGTLHAQVEDQKDSMDKLEAQFIELEEKLVQQRETIDQLESDRVLAKESRDKLDSEIKRLADRCNELAESEQGAQKELGELQKSHETLVQSLRAEEAGLKERLADIETKLDATTKERNRLKDALESKSREKLEEERDRLTFVIGQLEEELREATDMIQAYVTDETSEKATESAALALRNEIEELQAKVYEHRMDLESERTAREMAEHEVERLGDDLATLVSVSNQEDPASDIHLLSAKAAEKVKKRERAEIDQLRKSLFRALDELDIARAAEKEANENLSKTRLQASVCEQEIIASKSEVNFLTQTMEDMREAEENRRASLEYRISSLENDYEVLRRYHSGEIENLQNEVAQVTMEKDRILHTLKESERTNSALVFAASKGESETDNDSSDPDTEVAKLRVENAHLLTIAADEKAKTERRLREVLAAQAASAEADVILERELRIAAEAAVKTMKVELEERRKDGNGESGLRDKEGRSKTQDSLAALTSEVDRLKNDLQKINKESANLKSKLEDSTTKAKSQIDALTEECRKAQAKAHKLEREGRFDAAVKSEVARLRTSPGRSSPNKRDAGHEDWMLVSNDPAVDQTSLVGTGAYDYIQKQREAILEERQMYVELLTEHDDLLALLAQHDHERVCLREAFAKAVGQEAVDAAIQKAGEKSLSQYGQVLRMS